MAKKYWVEVVNRWLVETDDMDEVRENYEFSDVNTESVIGEPEYLDGHITWHEAVEGEDY